MRQISNHSSVAIIYRLVDPSQIFIEMKDDGHPIRLVRRQLCPIGGNWIGKGAKWDSGPQATVLREVTMEELSFDHPSRDSVELVELGHTTDTVFTAPTKRTDMEVSQEDKADMDTLKSVIQNSLTPFADFLDTVSKDAMDSVDPANKREGFTVLSSYFTVGLDEEIWAKLVCLQEKFGNLSNESVTLITSLSKIIESNTYTAFGHDRPLQMFFASHGLADAAKLPLAEGVNSLFIGAPRSSYADYAGDFTAAKKP
jgi:hypothetical protein